MIYGDQRTYMNMMQLKDGLIVHWQCIQIQAVKAGKEAVFTNDDDCCKEHIIKWCDTLVKDGWEIRLFMHSTMQPYKKNIKAENLIELSSGINGKPATGLFALLDTL